MTRKETAKAATAANREPVQPAYAERFQAPLTESGSGLHTFLRLYEPLIVFSAVLFGALFVRYQAPVALLGGTVLGIVVLPLTHLARVRLRHGDIEAAVLYISIGLWMLSLTVALAGGQFYAVAVLISVGAIILAVPFAGRRANIRSVVVSMAVGAIGAGLSLIDPVVPLDPVPIALAKGLAAAYAVVVLALYALIAWQSNARLRETMQEMRHANRALAESERGLERKVAERTADLTHSQQNLALARDEALAANQAKSAFLASMSHELRTPLNAVIGYSEILQEEAEESGHAEYLADLEKITSSSHHLLRLINDVLDLSKIEADRIELFAEPIDIAALVRDIALTVGPLVAARSNSLEMIVPDNVGTMHSDITRIRQILLNLLSNAAKFTTEGTIELAVARGPDNVVFTVRDTGIGMTAEQTARIFDAFSQADAATSRDYGGTGLGLTITRRFCTLLGGDVQVDSQPGAGSVFCVNLPITLPDANEPETLASPADDSTKPFVDPSPARILVVDDDPLARDLLQRQLSKEGHEVATASGGEECLRLVGEWRPALITLDVLMPEMDGWTVLTRLKADPATADIPVILVSMVDERHVGYTLGAVDYLTKPVDRERLSALLGRYLPREDDGPADKLVLVVDDDERARDLFRRALDGGTTRVVEASDGIQALQRMAQEPPDLIVLDLLMPKMDGFEFLNALQRDEACRLVPVIIVTAKDLTKKDRRQLDRSAARVLRKGEFGHEELIAEIDRLVRQRQPGTV